MKGVSFGGKDYDSMMAVLFTMRSNPIQGKKGQLYYLGKSASECEWYVGMQNRAECEKMVLAAGKSDYCVRLASNKKQYVVVINEGNGKIKNCPIKIGEGGDLGKFILRDKKYTSVEDVLDDLKQVPIPASDGTNLYLRKIATSAKYYAAQMPRAECETFVKKSRHGDYLIRQNSAGTQYVLVVNDNGGVLNFIVKILPNGKFEMAGLPHDSLEMLLRHLKRQPLASKNGGDIYLANPARMTSAEDIMADIEFGLDDSDSDYGDDDFGGGGGGGNASISGGGMPDLDYDDEDIEDANEGFDDDYGVEAAEDDEEGEGEWDEDGEGEFEGDGDGGEVAEDDEGGEGGDDDDEGGDDDEGDEKEDAAAAIAQAKPAAVKFDPFRVSAIADIDADGLTCSAGEGLFVIGEDGDNWKVVYKGDQLTVAKESVEKQAERQAVAYEEPEDDEDDEDGFEEDPFANETEEERAVRVAKGKEESEARIAQLKIDSEARQAEAAAALAESSKADEEEEARLNAEAAEMEAKLAALENSDDDNGVFLNELPGLLGRCECMRRINLLVFVCCFTSMLPFASIAFFFRAYSNSRGAGGCVCMVWCGGRVGVDLMT